MGFNNVNGFLVGFLILFLFNCSSAPPLSEEEIKAEKSKVQQLFQSVRVAIKNGDGDKIFKLLSENTRDWFKDIEDATFTESMQSLKEREFYEILAILAVRVTLRMDSDFKVDPESILEKIVVSVGAVKKSFVNFPLGPYHLEGEEAWVGLNRAKNTPVFYFTRNRNKWEFDLVRSLPLILRGAESIALQEHDEPLMQAIYIIEKAMNIKLETADLLM